MVIRPLADLSVLFPNHETAVWVSWYGEKYFKGVRWKFSIFYICIRVGNVHGDSPLVYLHIYSPIMHSASHPIIDLGFLVDKTILRVRDIYF